MKVLIIGGNRFMGYHLAWRLLLSGVDVSVLNRGSAGDPFLGRATRLVADRLTSAFGEVLREKRFDAVVDFAAFDAPDVEGVLAAFPIGSIGHYVFISTGQVYLVRDACPTPSKESDYEGPVMLQPPTPADTDDWLYGVRKRAAEEVLSAAWRERGFPVTRLRIPVVLGERDPVSRVQQYILRMLDGGPILLRDGGRKRVRPVYGPEVARTLHGLLGRTETFGQVYNLAQEEMPTVLEFTRMLAEALDTKVNVVSVDDATLAARGLLAKQVSPFDGRWTSMLDPGLAKQAFQFQHQPMAIYLEKIVRSFVDHGPVVPAGYHDLRTVERALSAEMSRIDF